MPRAAMAAPPTKKECGAAYEETQALRKDGKLQAARERALVCAQDACPAFVRGDCAKWLAEVEASLPTLVFEVRDARGQETAEVRLFVDGALARERIGGTALPLDPGEHALRFEMPGAEPVEQRVVVREGDKLRKVAVAFAAAGGAAPDGGAEPATPPETAPEPAGGGPPALAYVLGGVGVVGVGAFAALGLVGLGEYGELEEECAPACSDDQVASVRTKFLIGDIALAVGVVSLGAAAVLFFTSSDGPDAAGRPAPSLQFGAAPIEGGGFAQVRGTF